jgi:aryl-alcohol dehydrogenase-like predicted oxidoreductase
MRYRKLGKTGFEISEIGFGSWGISGQQWIGAKENESMNALNRAIDLGLNFIDTALAYGDGNSEKLIGKVLKEREECVCVATKVPPKNKQWPAIPGTPYKVVFPTDWVLECTEKSLKNLGVDKLDIMQFHVWQDEWTKNPEWQNTIQKLKDRGLISFYGISVGDHDPENILAAIKTGLVDTIQVIYNIFDQTPEEKLFPKCKKNKIGVIARCPLDEGGLTGNIKPNTVFPKGDWRNSYWRNDRKMQVYNRVKVLEKLLVKSGIADTMTEAALRFCISHTAVTTVIPGMRKVQHVESNCAVSDKGPLPKSILKHLKEHIWRRNFYGVWSRKKGGEYKSDCNENV